MPAATVNAPQMRNNVRQGAMDSEVFLPIPYIRRQPTIWARPFIVTHRLAHVRCILYKLDDWNIPSPGSMLALLIPNGRDGHKGRGNGALSKAQKKPDCCKASKAFRRCKTHTDNTP